MASGRGPIASAQAVAGTVAQGTAVGQGIAAGQDTVGGSQTRVAGNHAVAVLASAAGAVTGSACLDTEYPVAAPAAQIQVEQGIVAAGIMVVAYGAYHPLAEPVLGTDPGNRAVELALAGQASAQAEEAYQVVRAWAAFDRVVEAYPVAVASDLVGVACPAVVAFLADSTVQAAGAFQVGSSVQVEVAFLVDLSDRVVEAFQVGSLGQVGVAYQADSSDPAVEASQVVDLASVLVVGAAVVLVVAPVAEAQAFCLVAVD